MEKYRGIGKHEVGEIVSLGTKGRLFLVQKDGVQEIEGFVRWDSGKTPANPALAALKHHVTGAIERGEAQPIVEQPALPQRWEDVILSPEEVWQLKSYGESHFAYYEMGRKISKYIDLHLLRDEKKSFSRNAGNCYNVGTDYYTRKDGWPIRTEDLIAVQNNVKGQGNTAVLISDGMEIKRDWQCDSSD